MVVNRSSEGKTRSPTLMGWRTACSLGMLTGGNQRELAVKERDSDRLREGLPGRQREGLCEEFLGETGSCFVSESGLASPRYPGCDWSYSGPGGTIQPASNRPRRNLTEMSPETVCPLHKVDFPAQYLKMGRDNRAVLLLGRSFQSPPCRLCHTKPEGSACLLCKQAGTAFWLCMAPL